MGESQAVRVGARMGSASPSGTSLCWRPWIPLLFRQDLVCSSQGAPGLRDRVAKGEIEGWGWKAED